MCILGISACGLKETRSRGMNPMSVEAARAYINAPPEEKETRARRLAEVLNRAVASRHITRTELVELFGTPLYEDSDTLHYAVLEIGASRLELGFYLRKSTLLQATLGIADVDRGQPAASNALPSAIPE